MMADKYDYEIEKKCKLYSHRVKTRRKGAREHRIRCDFCLHYLQKGCPYREELNIENK